MQHFRLKGAFEVSNNSDIPVQTTSNENCNVTSTPIFQFILEFFDIGNVDNISFQVQQNKHQLQQRYTSRTIKYLSGVCLYSDQKLINKLFLTFLTMFLPVNTNPAFSDYFHYHVSITFKMISCGILSYFAYFWVFYDNLRFPKNLSRMPKV